MLPRRCSSVLKGTRQPKLPPLFGQIFFKCKDKEKRETKWPAIPKRDLASGNYVGNCVFLAGDVDGSGILPNKVSPCPYKA